MGDDLGVACIWRLGAEDPRSPDRLAEDLVQHGQLELAVPLAAELRAEVAGPQAALSHLLLERVDDVALLLRQLCPRQVVVPGPEQVKFVHLVGDELVRPVEQLLEFGLDGEIPAHRFASPVVG
jgi:hypothetical protein